MEEEKGEGEGEDRKGDEEDDYAFVEEGKNRDDEV